MQSAVADNFKNKLILIHTNVPVVRIVQHENSHNLFECTVSLANSSKHMKQQMIVK